MALKRALRGDIDPFIVMQVMSAAQAREAAGEAILHLEVGQPGSGAPSTVIAAAEKALHGDRIGYTTALGIPELRQSIAGHYQRHYGLEVPLRNVIVTTGSSGGFLLSFLAAFDAGDRVALALPCYPAYRNILTALGVEVVEVPAGAAERYQPTPELLDKLEGPIHGLIVASPSNPAGTMLSPEAMAGLAGWCRRHDVRLISDEIYHGVTYGDVSEVTARAFTNDAVVINSFSKYFSMTGWRLGWMIVPDDLLEAVERLAQNFFISPPTLSQIAAVAAFDATGELDGHVKRYAVNRGILRDALEHSGFREIAPCDGAFYLYADLAGLDDDSGSFCRRLLADTGIAATPGLDFDPKDGHRKVRFSFAGPTADITEAARRIHEWVRKHRL